MTSPGWGGKVVRQIGDYNGDKGGGGLLASGDAIIKKDFHLDSSFCILLKHFSQKSDLTVWSYTRFFWYKNH